MTTPRRRRVRGVGHGRKTRRALERGGTGAARALNAVLGGWDGVRITPMFGRWGYFRGESLFACFPLRERDRDLWIRLAPADQARALREPGVRPHRRFAGRGWVELTIESEADIPRALGWLRRARAAAARSDDAGAELR
ncbi:MAG TPA: luciferase family protein [Methylomirabilota bacterium]